jgi:hypothetical protein
MTVNNYVMTVFVKAKPKKKKKRFENKTKNHPNIVIMAIIINNIMTETVPCVLTHKAYNSLRYNLIKDNYPQLIQESVASITESKILQSLSHAVYIPYIL